MTGREQRRRHIVGALGRDVGNDAALIFVGTDMVDRCTRASKVSPSMVRITSTGCRMSGLPARRQITSASSALLSVACGTGQCTQCRTGNIVPAATPSTNTHGSAAENRRRQGERPSGAR